jgi:tetratricopeptide (TPR) repeat protein
MEEVEVDGATVRIPDGLVRRARRPWGAKQEQEILRLLRSGETAAADELVGRVVAGSDAGADWWFVAAETARALDATDRATDAYEAALERRPDAPALWWARLGSAALADGRSARAAEAYERAIQAREKSPAGWHRDLAKAYAASGRPADAVTVWAKVVDAQENPSERSVFDLVRYLVRAGRRGEASQRLLSMLDRDASARPLDRVLAANNPEMFGMRRAVLHFVEDHLPQIRAGAQESLRGDADRRSTIWTYWAQGWDDVPGVVAMCHRRLLELAGPDVASLDSDSAAELVQIPADIDGMGLGHAARSDLLRLELLGRYGGTWIDSTCFVTEDPRPHLADLSAGGFFAFEKSGSTLATWIMSSEPDSYLVRMARSALHVYLRENKEWSYYFLFHFVFEALTLCDDEFGRLWTASPRRKLGGPTAFKQHRTQQADTLDIDALFARSFVQKLSYRHSDEALKTPGSFLNHLLANY